MVGDTLRQIGPLVLASSRVGSARAGELRQPMAVSVEWPCTRDRRREMNVRIVAALLFAAVFSGAHAQGARQKTFEEIVNAPVVLELPGMGNVQVLQNERYTHADDANLLMDIYLPPGLKAGEKRPVMIFIHGGAGSDSRPKDWGIYRAWGRLAAASGLVGVTFTHRLGYPKPLLRESESDVSAAIDFVRSNAARFRADPDRLCLAAYSAGGPLLAVGLDEKRPYVRCLVAVYAFLDIQQSNLHREHEPAERVRKFAVIEHLGSPRAKRLPWFVARAGLDEIPMMNDSIDRFIGRAITENVNLTVMNHPTGVHGFDNQNDDDRSREIIAAILEFVRRHTR
jgi:acetyl esterase/lipase